MFSVVAAFAFAMNMKVWVPASTGTAPAEAGVHTEALSSMFDTRSDVVITSTGMMVVSPQVRMVMLVRRAEDGSLVTKCVTSAEQAEGFLHPKVRVAVANEVQEK